MFKNLKIIFCIALIITFLSCNDESNPASTEQSVYELLINGIWEITNGSWFLASNKDANHVGIRIVFKDDWTCDQYEDNNWIEDAFKWNLGNSDKIVFLDNNSNELGSTKIITISDSKLVLESQVSVGGESEQVTFQNISDD